MAKHRLARAPAKAEAAPAPDARARLLLAACAFASGCASLVYQVLWTRQLTFAAGNTAAVIGMVLACFMAGGAFGGYMGGCIADARPTLRSLLRLYAICELSTAAGALLAPLLISRIAEPWAALLLIPAATAIGAVFPILSKLTDALSSERPGIAAGRVYFLYTAGAVAGVIASGFLVIPALGGWQTTVAFALSNVLLATCALVMATRDSPVSHRQARESAEENHGGRWLELLLFASGVAAFVYEVAFTRALSMVFGPTTYAFSLMLAIFLSGLAVGAGIMGRWRSSRSVLGGLQMAVAGLVLVSVFLIPSLPVWTGELTRRFQDRLPELGLAYGALAASVLLGPAVAMGMAFAGALQIGVRKRERAGRDLGRLYAVNTLGCIVGALGAGMVLVPLLGFRQTIFVGLLMNALAGSLLLAKEHRRTAAATLLAVAVLSSLLPPWSPALLSGGAYKYASGAGTAPLRVLLERGELLFYREGARSTVSVRRLGRDRLLAIDGKVDASDAGGDLSTEKLLAHIPLLTRTGTRRVSLIGLASGVTAHSILQHPVERLDVVEILPDVVEASGFFRHVNMEPLNDTRLRLHVTDARRFLARSTERYDLIVSEPSNPWMAGVSPLFTREFFELARHRLTPGGTLAQWFHTYNMRLEELRTLVRTFTAVFPGASLWILNQSDLLLVGSEREPALDSSGWKRPQVSADLKSIAVDDPFSVASLYRMRGTDLREFAGTGPENTDDKPLLEFAAPRFLHAKTDEANLRELTVYPTKLLPPPALAQILALQTAERYAGVGRMFAFSESWSKAYEAWHAASKLHVSEETLAGLRRAAGASGLQHEAVIGIRALNPPEDAAIDVIATLAGFDADGGDVRGCIARLEATLTAQNATVYALAQLASCYEAAGDWSALADAAREMMRRDPRNAAAPRLLGRARFEQGAPVEAATAAREALNRAPADAAAQLLLATSLARMKDSNGARKALLEAVRLAPADPMAQYNLGLFCLETGKLREAAVAFREAVGLDPANPLSYKGLGEALRRQGRVAEAAEWERRAPRSGP